MSYEDMEQRLVTLYNSMEGLDEQTPDGMLLPVNILTKLDAYRDVLEVLGDLHGYAAGQVEYYEFRIEDADADEFIRLEEEKEGTVEMRRKKAKKAKGEHHKQKAEWINTRHKWKNRYDTTLEIINILKWKMRDVHHRMNNPQGE